MVPGYRISRAGVEVGEVMKAREVVKVVEAAEAEIERAHHHIDPPLVLWTAGQFYYRVEPRQKGDERPSWVRA
jgi:hypothetical protein